MKHMPSLLILVIALAALVSMQGCEDFYTNIVDVEETTPETDDEERMFLGAYIGEDCSETSDCRDGLVCEAQQCVGGGNKPADAKCLLTIECDGTPNPPEAPHGLHCGWAGFCVKSCVGCPWCGDGICNGDETNGNCSADCGAGESGEDCEDLSGATADLSLGATGGPSCSADAGKEGTDCSTSSECDRDFFCDMQGLSGFCTRPNVPAGKGDLGDQCDGTQECFLGLRCSEITDTCVPGSILLYPDLFGGEDCSGSQQMEAFMDFGVRMAIPNETYATHVPVSCVEDDACVDGVCCAEGSLRAGTCAPSDDCDDEVEASTHLDFFSFPFPNDGIHVFQEDVPCGSFPDSEPAALACSVDVECGAGSICCGEDTERSGICAAEDECDVPAEEAISDGFEECPRGLRARAGTVNYQNFPVPGNGLIGFDPIGATIRALDGEMEGWSLMQATTLRFTRPVDEATLNGNVFMVNLETGQAHPSLFKSEAIRNKFSCANRVFVQPLLSHPLNAGTTYAVIVTTGVRELSTDEAVAGESARALESLPMLLSTAQPAPGMARDVWQSFQALRDKIGQGDVPVAASIAGATVFTAGDPTSAVDEIRTLIDGRDAPEISWSKKCEGTETVSRCGTPDFSASGDDTDPRGCQSPNQFYTEYHTQIEIPVIQTGTRPYIELEDGNALSGDLNHVNGTLEVVTTEKVCVAISVPNVCDPSGCTPGTPDMVNSHPVLLYGHGTGGTHRQGIALLGTELASPVKITTADGSDPDLKERFVVVAWDQPMHHLRRFPEGAIEDWGAASYTLSADYVDEYTKEPGPLFYNFQNPRAARGNYLQAVADTFSLVKVLSQGSIEVDGDTIGLDASRLSYHGHSQGGGNGPMVAPFEPDLDLMILSGTGGGTVDGIMGKKLPYDASIGCRIMLQEIDVSRSHPGIQVLQHYFDAIDPGIYAPLLADPPSKRGMNFMEVVGVRDSFTPPVSMAAYARGADLDLLSPSNGLPVWFDALEEGQSSYIGMKGGDYVSGPQGANRTVAEEDVTHISVQHPPCPNDSVCTAGVPALPVFDGHFVVYQNTDALKEALSFLYSWADGGEAVVTPYGSNSF
ncbi:MAG: hypothetical protein ACPGU1_18350 [Myxococcota bacterium]